MSLGWGTYHARELPPLEVEEQVESLLDGVQQASHLPEPIDQPRAARHLQCQRLPSHLRRELSPHRIHLLSNVSRVRVRLGVTLGQGWG